MPRLVRPHPRIEGKPDLRKIKPATLKRLFSYLGEYKKQLILVVISIVISSLTLVVSALFLQVLIDDYIAPLLLEAVPDFSGLLRVILLMGIIYLTGTLATLLYNWLMVGVAQGALKRIRDDLFGHMQSLPIRFFDRHSHGDVMSYYTNDADTLRQMLTMSLPQVVSALVTMVSVLLSMLYLSFWLTLFVLVFAYFALRIVGFIAGRSGSYFIKQQQSLGETNGYIEEMISGLKVIKVFNREKVIKEEFDQKNELLGYHATEAHKYANVLMPIMHNLGYILYVLLAVIGGVLAIRGLANISLAGTGALTLGIIASFLQLSRSFINPLAQVTQQLNSIVMALAGAERIFDLMDKKSEEDHGYVTLVNVRKDLGRLVETDKRTDHWAWKQPRSDGSVTYTELRGEVRFFDVTFGYNEDEPVLKDITLYAETGQKLALVGSTGAGKTTITNLLTRFYDIADGKIRYDGININKIRKSDLRSSLGMVLQDVHLFSGTVMDNIRYGRLDATDEECIAAARLANADGFIRMLPKGYETELSGDGNSLSQGQRQLISIARAAVADPPVMILDEATSSIDTRTELIVQQGMDSLMHGRTVFIIAHRLSTVQNADVIMVIEEGRIIERGNHNRLLAEKGRYYQLYTGVFELT